MKFRKRNPPIASMPGTLAISSDTPKPRIHVMRYNVEQVDEFDLRDVRQIPELFQDNTMIWIDVQGLGDQAVLEQLAEMFSIHQLALADVVNVPQRPKVELYDEHLFLVMRMVELHGTADAVWEQLSLFLGRHYVLTFQEQYGDVLDPLRNRIRTGKGPVRRQGAAYLAYAVLDAIIDGYFPVLESLGDELTNLEEEALEARAKATLRKTNAARYILLTLRHVLWAQRDAINSLLRDENPLIGDTVRTYLRDCYDHCMQISEVVESYREVVGSITNTYLSSASNRMNEIMKILTVIASIFIPLTFVAGIYGMNFEHMPELHYLYAYPLLLAGMIVLAGSMAVYFWRRGWIGSGKERRD